MNKQNEYDELFTELKSQIQMNQSNKQQTLRNIKNSLSHEQDRKQKKYTPFIISITSVFIAACLMLLFIKDMPSTVQSNPEVGQQPNETNAPTPSEMDNEDQIFDVVNFGQAHSQLEQDILGLFQDMNPENVDVSALLDGVKVDEQGVAIINLTEAFIYTFPHVTSSMAKGELITALSEIVFSYDEINTVFVLIDGNASRWFEWMEFVHEPMTREMHEKVYHSFDTIFQVKDEKYYVFGVTLNDSKAKAIEMLGDNFTEEYGVVIDGEGPYHQMAYEHLELTLLFSNNQLATAIVQIPFPHEFDEFFIAYQGDKLTHKQDGIQTDEENDRIIFSEESLQAVTFKYVSNKGYLLYLESVAREDINNL